MYEAVVVVIAVIVVVVIVAADVVGKQPSRHKCSEAIKSSRTEGYLHLKQLQCNIELNNKRRLTS